MIGPAMDRGVLKDYENAPNSFFPKVNESPFWRFGTDMAIRGSMAAMAPYHGTIQNGSKIMVANLIMKGTTLT